jgi:uncharacterized protein (TIGR00251 family)
MPLRIEQSGPDVLLWIKAVPGASRDEISGALGERLKIRIAAPPEAGKANAAIRALLAAALGVKTKQVTIDAGHANAQKVVRIAGITVQQVSDRINDGSS